MKNETMKSTKPETPIAAGKIPVEKVAEADFPTRFGHFRICGFRLLHGAEPEIAVVLVKGEPQPGKVPLVRIHSQCLTGDVFGSLRCDCREQLEMALSQIGASEYGLLIYEQQEGRGIGLLSKLQAYALQDQGMDTVEANQQLGFEADLRQYTLAAGILQYYQVGAVRLLSNNPDKLRALEQAGIPVPERVPMAVTPQTASARYLKTKKEKMGHWFPEPEIEQG